MTLVKKYKDVSIFVNDNGEFYCDLHKNSNDYKNKTMSYFRLSEIEKAIDEYEISKFNGESYYDIDIIYCIIKKIKVIGKVGGRVFFDDETDTSSYNRKKLYSIESIDKVKENIDSLFNEIINTRKEINDLRLKENILNNEVNKIIRSINKVDVA